MEPLKTANRQNNLEKKDQSFSPPDFKAHYKVIGKKLYDTGIETNA